MRKPTIGTPLPDLDPGLDQGTKLSSCRRLQFSAPTADVAWQVLPARFLGCPAVLSNTAFFPEDAFVTKRQQ